MDQIDLSDYARLSLRVGTIREAAPHPNADKLLVLQVDLGEESPRQVVAGIKPHFPDLAELIGKQIAVIANLKPATLRGVESHGMLLAASDDAGLALLTPHKAVAPGSPIK